MRLPLLLSTLAVVALLPSPAPAGAVGPNAVFVDGLGAHPADFLWSGPCNGEGTITLVVHKGAERETRAAQAWSTSLPEACDEGGPRCPDCPPLPVGFAWALENPWENVRLAGGGAAAYQYQTVPLAWSLQGAFQDGWLEVRGVAGV